MDDVIFPINNYVVSGIQTLDSAITITLENLLTKSILKVNLENVVNFRDEWIDKNPDLSILRIDRGGTTYGFDFAIRLSKPKIRDYDVIYLFNQDKHIRFKALAEKIIIATDELAQ